MRTACLARPLGRGVAAVRLLKVSDLRFSSKVRQKPGGRTWEMRSAWLAEQDFPGLIKRRRIVYRYQAYEYDRRMLGGATG